MLLIFSSLFAFPSAPAECILRPCWGSNSRTVFFCSFCIQRDVAMEAVRVIYTFVSVWPSKTVFNCLPHPPLHLAEVIHYLPGEFANVNARATPKFSIRNFCFFDCEYILFVIHNDVVHFLDFVRFFIRLGYA